MMSRVGEDVIEDSATQTQAVNEDNVRLRRVPNGVGVDDSAILRGNMLTDGGGHEANQVGRG